MKKGKKMKLNPEAKEFRRGKLLGKYTANVMATTYHKDK